LIDLEIDEVQATKLAIAPGEVLLLRVSPLFRQQEAERIRDAFVTSFGKAGVEVDPQRILVVAGGELDVSVIEAPAETPEAFERELAGRWGTHR
jgi:hypothetical protein